MATYQPHDRFYREARAKGLPSRASFKLSEIIDRYHLVAAGARVVDLGCAPGGWLAILAPAVGSAGAIVGIDLVKCEASTPWVSTIVGDIGTAEVRAAALRMLGARADLVTSDMAPKLTGVSARDEACSLELVEKALGFAREVLRTRGAMVVKVFMSRDFKEIVTRFERLFRQVTVTRPQASRPGSAELFVIARSRRNAAG